MTDSLMSAPQKKALDSMRELLQRSHAQIAMALPRHMTADRVQRLVLTSLQRTPALLDCHPVSVVGAVVQAAQLGLECDGALGHAYLVPFKNRRRNRIEAQFIPGYRGLIDLARRSGQLSTVSAHVVRDGDAFEYSFGLEPVLVHKPKPGNSKSEPTYFYAIARLKDGGTQLDVMDRSEVDAIRARSKASDDGPWKTDYAEMGKKTVLRRLSKLLPMSVEYQQAIELDERAALDIPQDLSIIVDPDELGTTVEDVVTEGNGGQSVGDDLPLTAPRAK